MPSLDQPVEDAVEEDLTDPALDQAVLSAPTGTTAVKPLDWDKTMKRYPVMIPYMKGVSGRYEE